MARWVSLCLLALALGGCGGGKGSTVTVTSEQSAAGRLTCEDKTPLEVAQRLRSIAEHRGPRKRFAEMVVDPTPAIEESPGYPRLVAALYATTLPPPKRAQAAAACAEELAAASHGR